MCLQYFLQTDPAVCSEVAFQISSLRMYEKSACDHFPPHSATDLHSGLTQH